MVCSRLAFQLRVVGEVVVVIALLNFSSAGFLIRGLGGVLEAIFSARAFGFG
ncbi:hypothetical protein D3C81_2277990 [compost metagenome]